MEIHHLDRFLPYFDRLRGCTLRVFACVPEDRLEWRPAPGRFSFGDVLRHLAGMERHVYVENVLGRAPRYPGHGIRLATGLAGTLAYAERLHREAHALLAPLAPEDLQRRVGGLSGSPITAWKLLRAMAEHEAHHRGQVYLMLGLLGVATPPVFGLTSEAVYALSAPPSEGAGPPAA